MRLRRRGRGMGDDGEVTITSYPGGAIDSEGNVYGNPILDGSGGSVGGSTPIDWSKIINSSIGGALNIFKATSSPYVIPGTTSVYDPATGRVLGQTLPGQVSNPFSNVAGSIAAGSGGSLLLIGGGLLAVVLLGSLFKK